ncbi:hypothetical protein HJG60_012065 [Phyllostomus discolor]|uniref:Uncharacterized protein n=1 Tax=Phyllostomus discolor TaxID=89673 RepID=A0A833ZLH3_9CHIR|nr:hypothetical protein HJG60_012065 [Phyllostomus discolor]
MQSSTHRNGAHTRLAQLGPEHRRCHLAATGCCSLTSSPWRRSLTLRAAARLPPAPSPTCACDTVNLPESPITYLFWVLTLRTQTTARECCFGEKKRKEQRKKKQLHSKHFLVLCYACMRLTEGIRPICCRPLSDCLQAPPGSTFVSDGAPRRAEPPDPPWSPGHLWRPPTQQLLLAQVCELDSCPRGKPTGGPGVARHPADPSISQHLFPTMPSSQAT